MSDDLVLVPARAADAARVLAALEPAATRNLSFFAEPLTLAREEAYLREMEESAHDRLFFLAAGERLIGSTGLHEIDLVNGTARLGLLVFHAAERGRGYGTAAARLVLAHGFGELGLHKVYLNAFATNHRGQALWCRLGFVAEGRLRAEYLLAGARHDLIRMALLVEEWRALAAAG